MVSLKTPEKKLYPGIDIGAVSLKYVILDRKGKIVHSAKPVMHFANPFGALRTADEQIKKFAKDNDAEIVSTSFTGNGSRFLSRVLDLNHEYDSVSIYKGVKHIVPDSDYDLHLGAKNPFFFHMTEAGDKVVADDISLGTKCGGGSGILVEKQSRRLFGNEFREDIKDPAEAETDEEREKIRQQKQKNLEDLMGFAVKEAFRAKNPIKIMSRCGVVTQSDMIHAQNEGAHKEDQFAGMSISVARNFDTDVLGTRKLDSKKKTVVTGGLASNKYIVQKLEERLGVKLIVPEEHHNVAAIGIALKAIEDNDTRVFDIDRLDEVTKEAKKNRLFVKDKNNNDLTLEQSLENVEVSENNDIDYEWGQHKDGKVNVILGIDGGSTTTKIAMINLETGELMAKLYIKTDGDPVRALREVMEYARGHESKINIYGVSTTGSARLLYDKLLVNRSAGNVIDKVPDEITCHAEGVKHYNEDIDTILEVGGQDMKFTRFVVETLEELVSKSTSQVENSKMNYSCQAGAGQTMENMAEMIGLTVQQLNEYALRAKYTPIIDHTCGVFMEIEVYKLIEEGFGKEEIAAAIVRATAASYFYKFVGGEKLGEHISAQGGPPLGKAFLAALAQVTGKKIYAFKHREMFGAYGAGLRVRKEILKAKEENNEFKTGFRGLNSIITGLDKILEEKARKKEKDSEPYRCSNLVNDLKEKGKKAEAERAAGNIDEAKKESLEKIVQHGKSARKCKDRNCNLDVFEIEGDYVISGDGCGKWNRKAEDRTKDHIKTFQRIFNESVKGKAMHLDDLTKRKKISGFRNTLDFHLAEFHKTGLTDLADNENLDPEIKKDIGYFIRRSGCKGLKLEDFFKEGEDKITVGIKRSTTGIGSRGVWAAAFFNELGLQPVISPVSNEEIAELGVNNSHTEYCIAMKLAIGHAAKLQDNVDYIFNPSYIDEIDPETKKKLKYCVYIESESFVAEDALNMSLEKSINPIIHFNDKCRPVDKAMHGALKRAFGKKFSMRQVRKAIKEADQAEKEFEKKIANAGDKFVEDIENNNEKGYVLIGRDYVTVDRLASSDAADLGSELGYKAIQSIFLKHKSAKETIDDKAENMFWKRGKEIIESALYVAKHPNLYPVIQTNFGCGTDTMIYFTLKAIMDAAGKPMLVLQTDAHDNNAPFRTRWEAFNEIVKQHTSKEINEDNFKLNPIVENLPGDLRDREWLFPYMGEGSRMGAAAARSAGIKAKVAPANTPEAHEYAQKHVTTEACLPTKGVVGDMIAELYRMKEDGKDPNKDTAIMLPSAEGPCRFGQYRVLLRQFLDKEGFDNVPIVSPMSVNDYQDIPLNSKKKKELISMSYIGMPSFDILYDALLRVRPYEKEKGKTDEVFNKCLKTLEDAVQSGDRQRVIDTMNWSASMFKKIKYDDSERKPAVLYAGEIYMRWHDEFTQDSVKKLEEEGLEVIRQPLSEWMHYVNKSHIRKYIKQRNIKQLLKVGVKALKMQYIDKKLRKPFEDLLRGREFHNPMDFIDAVEKNQKYTNDIEGESPLSIGTFYELMHNEFESKNGVYLSGIFHVGPWMCMQETTATAKINAMKNNYDGEFIVPILHASYGETPNPNLDAEIAVFREQCYARKDQMKDINPDKKQMSFKESFMEASFKLLACGRI